MPRTVTVGKEPEAFRQSGLVCWSGSKMNPSRTLHLGLLLLPAALAGCFPRTTENPAESYRFWSGQIPGTDVTVLHGRYRQSAHWTKEYVVYLELRVTPRWREEFFRLNSFVPADTQWTLPADAPDWFRPPGNFRGLMNARRSNDSRCFEDSATGHLYIFGRQL